MPNKPEIFEVGLHVLMNDDLKGQNFYHTSAKCLWKETVVIVFIADVVFFLLRSGKQQSHLGASQRYVGVNFRRTNQLRNKTEILNIALSESRSTEVCTLIVSSGKNRPGWLSYNPSRILISCSVNEHNFYMYVFLSLFCWETSQFGYSQVVNTYWQDTSRLNRRSKDYLFGCSKLTIRLGKGTLFTPKFLYRNSFGSCYVLFSIVKFMMSWHQVLLNSTTTGMVLLVSK